MTNVNQDGMLGEIEYAVAKEYDWPDFFQLAEYVPVAIDPRVFDACTGDYELRPGFIFSVGRMGDDLYVQPTDQDPISLIPESETRFFSNVVDAKFSFSRTEEGRIEALVFWQNGREMTAKKI